MKVKPIVIVVTVVTALLGLLGGSSLVWSLFILTAILILLGMVLARITGAKVSIHQKNTIEVSRVGKWIEKETVISNGGRLPGYGLTIRQITDVPGHEASILLNLTPVSSQTWHTRMLCHRRGIFHQGICSITSTDPFGLVSYSRSVGQLQELLILPPVLDIPLFQPEVSAAPGNASGRWLRSGTSSVISRVREYAEGDMLNHIHWPSTARMNTLMVKVFEPDKLILRSRHVWIIPDMNRSVQAGTDEESTAEYAITIASSIFRKYMDAGKETGLIMSGDNHTILKPDTGSGHEKEVEKALALVKAEGSITIDELISQETHRFEEESIVIIITPSTDKKLYERVREIEERKCLAVVILIDPVGFGGRDTMPSFIRLLRSTGCQVYTIGKGQVIAAALDSRRNSSLPVYGE